MTSKEALEYLSENDFISVAVGGTNKQKHLEAYKVIKNDLDRLEKLEKKVERIKECIGMATSVTITDSLNSTKNDILAEVREVLKNA